ncbi:helix-turn-helix transcriptional regulator [Streptomyces sp. V4-01]|uniref:Helix-turn-helix transcriptional regulator n=1 Tax=Actinacidiphila polyblastidii TaxID=3110430 RepID=A0ABU7PIA7_9ACTN|nr:helix-turn-helix transcriptional regulator [Streptomyces sp. V4-01]
MEVGTAGGEGDRPPEGTGDASRLGADEVAVYGWIAAHEGVDVAGAAGALGLTPERVAAASASLTALRLVHEADGRLDVLDPDLVSGVMAAPVILALQRHQSELELIRERFSGLRDTYLRATRARSPKIEQVGQVEEVRAALTRAADECQAEILTCQPGGNRVPEVLEEALRRDTTTLARGVRMRTLYHHTARFNGPSQAYVATLSMLGAEYRTAHELFGRLIVFDQRVAFIPYADDSWGAVVIREPSIVHYLCRIFEQTWTLAQPFSDASVDGMEAVAADLDRTIARLLAAGMKDEAIGRRLGMSLRTVRRHIADMMEDLGAESRFQAGALMAAKGLLSDGDDQALTVPTTTG